MHTCYISYNASDDIGYVGYELGSGDSYYYGSSQLPMFLHAKRSGLLKKYILGHFEDEFTARNAETFSIKKLREGGMNLYNRNEGGGGKDGTLGDYRDLDQTFRDVIDSIANDRKFPDFRVRSTRRKMADNAIAKLEAGEYIRFEEHLSVLLKYTSIQTRHVQIDQVHVRNLCDIMVDDPIAFRSKTDPIAVIVDDRDPNDVKHYVLGGNHRIAASIEAGWDTFPTVYVNFSEFAYDVEAAKLFGVHDNGKNGMIQKALTTEDIRRYIETHMQVYPKCPLTSYEFKKSFVEEYRSSQLSEKKLLINLANFIKNKNEQKLISDHNFHQYGEKELKRIKKFIELDKRFADAVVLSDDVTTLQYNGVGGICNMLAKNALESRVYNRKLKKTGVIFARYSKVSETTDEEVHIVFFINSMKIAGFNTLDNRIWTNKDGYTVKLIMLPWKHESNDSPETWKSFREAIEYCLENDKVNAKIAA